MHSDNHDCREQGDTIAAIATAVGEAGIAIVRLSGQTSLAIADRVFRGSGAAPSERPGAAFIYGHVQSPATAGGEDLDEVILLIYRAPHSYTREDVVEIQGHGGRACAARILRAVLDAGARPAEPGEFTRRAFLNGRIDLLQAEAVADLIRARSNRAASAAMEQLEGGLSSAITSIYDELVDVAGGIEAALDFPEEELPESVSGESGEKLGRAVSRMRDLLATWEEGHLLRDGALIVISGKPNVGKSTLLNRLLGMDRAIVTDIAGTTRDTIEEQLVLDGIPLRLVDTAGLRDVECVVEREGVRRAQSSIRDADINIHVIDCSVPLDGEAVESLRSLTPGKSIIILNKTDLGVTVTPDDIPSITAIPCNLLEGDDVGAIKAALVEQIGSRHFGPPHAVISERHRQSVQNVLNLSTEALSLHESSRGDAAPLMASAIRAALDELGTITGRVYTNELLNNIFSRFCIGK